MPKANAPHKAPSQKQHQRRGGALKKVSGGWTPGKRLPREAEEGYWRLSSERRAYVQEEIKCQLHLEERDARDRELAARGARRRVAFLIEAEQYAVLKRLTDAVGRAYYPGHAAGDVFDWAFPLLAAVLRDKRDKSDLRFESARRLLWPFRPKIEAMVKGDTSQHPQEAAPIPFKAVDRGSISTQTHGDDPPAA